MNTPTVKQDPDAPIFPEILAASIKQLAESVQRWERAGIRQRVLVLLLHDTSKVPIRDIEYVLNSIASLETRYCIKKPATK